MTRLFMAALLVLTAQALPTQAGGPWNNQYCSVKIVDVRVVDATGQVIEERKEEKVTCDDGVKDFLYGMGIAESCQHFTWMMPLGPTLVEQRSIACKRMDGGYEVVPGYHYIK